ncbi:hypothetical protein [Azorhizobium doebereinerae]|uniref:hypothetical protein n=1 Tax=Azorhizobium doebereinerae TaxID=281091 RepID=UPI0003FCC303|nr:hypothetical protein [Azorhizobium doebereinerae]
MHRSRNRVQAALLACVALGAWVAGSAGMANAQTPADQVETLAAAVERLTARSHGHREISLKELGIQRPVVLNGMDARRDLFLPVPAGIPISDASVALEGRYLRGEGGRTTYVAAVDGVPVASRSVGEEQGSVSDQLPVSGEPRPSGFVNLNVAWSSVVGRDLCEDERSIGNVFEINPNTRFSYRYDVSAVRDIATAWSALPSRPVLLLPAGQLPPDVYDAAWRIGTVLARAGKAVQIRTLPRIGDELDTDGLTIPPALLSIAPFQSLARGGRIKITSDAEVGALLLLQRQGGVDADIIIGTEGFRAQSDTAMQALLAQFATAPGEAVASITKWRNEAGLAMAPTADTIRLVPGAGHPVLAISPEGGARAAGFLSDLWRSLAVVPAVRVAVAQGPDLSDASSIPLTLLGGRVGSFDVLARGEWSTTFDLSAMVAGGRVPGGFDLDVSAAPSAGVTSPIASIFFNDFLLGARSLKADGRPERIFVSVPHYALAARNTLRVVVQRQPLSDRCREVPQAFPVTVQPSSRVLLEAAPDSVDFIGVMPRYSDKATLIVPRTYLSEATSLMRVIALANAAGLPPERSGFSVVAEGAEARPDSAFLAVDARVAGVEGKVRVEDGRLVLNTSANTTLLDVAGLNRLGVAEAVKAGDRYGIVYRTIGHEPPALAPSLLLGRGDVTVFSSSGPVVALDTRTPDGSVEAADRDVFSVFTKVGRSVGSLVIAAGIITFLLFVLLAVLARRRAAKGH